MSKNEMIKIYSSKLGEKNGTKRIWIESQKLHQTSFAEHLRYEPFYDFHNKKIVLKTGFSNKISIREKNNMPIIDILNNNVNEIFKDFTYVVIKLYDDEIIIEPLRENLNQKIAKDKAFKTNGITAIEIFAGGGTLLKSFSDAGIKTVAAIDLEDKYLENLEANNPSVVTYCGDLAKLDVNTLPNADIVVAALPCEFFSLSSQKQLEDHPTASLGFYVLKIIDAIRPAVVIIEEVPNFASSAIASLARFVLKSFGYHISEKQLIGSEYGSLTKRKRYCMVASIKKGFEFDESFKTENKRQIKDILEIPLEERTWLTKENNRTIAYSLEKEKEHIRKGEGFRLARTSIHDKLVATVTKGYFKGRLTDPLLLNPDNSEMFSWFTPRELARINGLPENFVLTPKSKNTCGEIIGQGVCYEAFNALGKMIVNHFKSIEVDHELLKLEAFKSTISSNNINYSDKELNTFMSGSLF